MVLTELRAANKPPTLQVPESPKVRGYGFVTTPSPMPGQEGDPIMTWGEIQGTPQLLDPTDTPLDVVGREGGPTFKVQEASDREKAAIDLANKATKNLKPTGGFATPLHRATTIMRRGTTATPLLHQETGKMAVSDKMKLLTSSSLDSQLRASYASPVSKRPTSITRKSTGGTTPSTKAKTPSNKSAGATTLPSGAAASPRPSSITDDLF